MSAYNIEYFLEDFAKRTIKNLEYIEKEYPQGELFEVTQLINSLLGLIIIPVEAYKNTYKKEKKAFDKSLKRISPKDYQAIDDLLNRCANENRLFSDYCKNSFENKQNRICVSTFISHIRNSIAHGGNKGIHFYPIEEGKSISKIIFYDNKECKDEKRISEFCVKITIDELRILVNNISNLYCKFEKNSKITDKQDKYRKDICTLDNLMRNGRIDKSKASLELKGEED